mgnify:CR=1 FL=1
MPQVGGHAKEDNEREPRRFAPDNSVAEEAADVASVADVRSFRTSTAPLALV